MIEQLQELIKVVAEKRQYQQRAIGFKKASYADWEALNKGALDAVVETTEAVINAEAILRELTLQVYAETGSKTPADGVGIREVTKLDYDTKTAFNWAIEHSMALNLDKRGFEKIAKVSPPDFVTISQEPQATIATNLDDKIKYSV